MKKRILAAALACTLLAGCGHKRTEPQPAEPAAEGSVIAYVPLDDRPDNVGRVVYLAESLGYVLEMPEADDYRTRLKDQPLNSNNISGRVFLMFVVERDGTLTNIQVLQSPDSSLSDEAVRVLKTSPKWKPGKQRNQTVRVKYTLPIDFRIQN